MKYSNFEELPVWRAAIEFSLRVFEFTSKAEFRGLGDVRNQLERAAVSISNNIAEGFERGSNTELIQFLYIAKGSAGECRSMLRLCERSNRFSNFKSEISNLIKESTNISRQLNGWLESLKNSEIRGPKFLNDIERTRLTRKAELDEFDKEMEDFRRRHAEWLRRRSADPDIRLEDIR
jgi:four helix bundle protein